jgi:hypothetical protein
VKETPTEVVLQNHVIWIVKEVNATGTSEIEDDNDYRVISLTEPLSTTTYVYNAIHIPPVNFQQFKRFMFGSWKNNNVLYEHKTEGAIFSTISWALKYPLSRIKDNTETDAIETYFFE